MTPVTPQSSGLDYNFPGKRSGEVVLKVIHRHWFDIFSHLLGAVLAAILLIGTFIFIPLIFPNLLGGTNTTIFLFIENTLLIFVWLFIFLIWVDVWLDVWVVTDQRIINIEQKGLFVRHISELQYSKVQDATSEVEGPLATVLNFGDLYVQTAAEETRFVFRRVPDPVGVRDIVMRLAEERRKSDNLELATGIATASKQSFVQTP